MRQNDYLKPGERAARIEIGDQECPKVGQESVIELGQKARQEVECFINGYIDDSTKGWPVLSRIPEMGIDPRLRRVS
jgi:hypothetical protein